MLQNRLNEEEENEKKWEEDERNRVNLMMENSLDEEDLKEFEDKSFKSRGAPTPINFGRETPADEEFEELVDRIGRKTP